MLTRTESSDLTYSENKSIQQDCEKKFEKLFGQKVSFSEHTPHQLKKLTLDLDNIDQFIQPKESKQTLEREKTTNFHNVYQAFQSVETIGALSSNADIQRAAQLGMVATQIAQASFEIISGGLAAGPAGAIIAGIYTVFSLCSEKKRKTKEDPFAVKIIESMQVISTQISNMHEHLARNIHHMHTDLHYMHADMQNLFSISFELFFKNFANQRIIYQTLCEGFKYLDELITSVHSNIIENHRVIRAALERLEARLVRSTTLINYKLNGLLLQPLRNLLNQANDLCEGKYENNVPALVESTAIECVNWLKPEDGKSTLDWLTGALYLQPYTPECEHSRIINETLRDITSRNTMENMGFLTQYALYYLGIDLFKKHDKSKIPVSPVFNPLLWNIILEKYINLKIKFPEYVKDKDDRDFNQIIAAGKNQLLITQSLRSFELFDGLFRQYQTILDQELMPLIQTEFKNVSIKLYNERISHKETRSTGLFDLRESLQTLINSWCDAKPVTTNIEGENIGINLNGDYDHPFVSPPLVVLAERLSLIYFHRFLNWRHTYKNINEPIEGVIEVKIRYKYSADSIPIHLQTNLYKTIARPDPDIDGCNLYAHWKSKSGANSVNHSIPAEEMTKMRRMILGVCLDYRAQAYTNLLNQKFVNQVLYRLEAMRCLLIHYAIAAGFKSEDIELFKKDIWGSEVITDHFNHYINQIKTRSHPEEKLAEIPLPMMTMTHSETVRKKVLSMLRDYKPDNFASDSLGNIQAIMAKLYFWKLGSQQPKPLEMKLTVPDDKEIKGSIVGVNNENLLSVFERAKMYYRVLKEYSSRINTEEKTLSDLALKNLSVVKSTIDKLDSLITEKNITDVIQVISKLKELSRGFSDLNVILKRVRKSFKYDTGEEVLSLITHLQEVINDLSSINKSEEKRASFPSVLSKGFFHKSSEDIHFESKQLNLLMEWGKQPISGRSVIEAKFDQLKKQANRYGYNVKEMERDGNCFFHAVADQLNSCSSSKKYTHEELRQLTVKHIAENITIYRDFIKGDIPTFISNSSKKEKWAEDIIPLALARALNLNLIIFNSDGSKPIIIKRNTAPTILTLGYEVDNHYNSLIKAIDTEDKSEQNIFSMLSKVDLDEFNTTSTIGCPIN